MCLKDSVGGDELAVVLCDCWDDSLPPNILLEDIRNTLRS